MKTDNRKNISVLIVEDESVVRELLERTMLSEGYKVQTACDGREAWKLIQEDNTDIIISDAKMPHMDGFELLKRTKAEHPSIGFIIMTAFDDSYSIKEAMLLGADEYISKPFESIEVALIVDRACWNMQLAQKAESTTFSGETV